MTDLKCVWCGFKATYADAQMEDRLQTCDGSVAGRHCWRTLE